MQIMQPLDIHDKDTGLYITISQPVLNYFQKKRQTGLKPEAGGQLFGSFPNAQRLIIKKATGPQSLYKRQRFLLTFDRKTDQLEIEEEFKMNGLHYVGDWHTHPHPSPTPSPMDINTFASRFNQSTHELNYMVMIIVGTTCPPSGLWIGLQDTLKISKLILPHESGPPVEPHPS